MLIGMPRNLLLVATAFLLRIVLEKAILNVDPLSGAYADVRQAAYVLLLFPAVEEVSRAACAWTLGGWNRSAGEAAAIGLGIGSVEFIVKAWGHGPLVSMMSLTSFPIHVTLSLAFYSFASGRVMKSLGLHVLINSTRAAAGFVLHTVLGAYAVGLRAAVSIVSVAICGRVRRGLALEVPRSSCRGTLRISWPIG
jgi:hypothetical protein